MTEQIDCPLCGAIVRNVSSATLSLALWQHVNWSCQKSRVCSNGDVGYHRRHRKDTNHDDIAKAFEELGWSVKDTSQLGDGFVDMVVARSGINVLIEVKRPGETLRKSQRDFTSKWQGLWYTVRSVDDVKMVEYDIYNLLLARKCGYGG